jgi:hypothetical protein
MEERDRIVETFTRLVRRYHELRDRDGIDAPATEWARAEISGARAMLEATIADRERGTLYAEVRIRTGKGIPARYREALSQPSVPLWFACPKCGVLTDTKPLAARLARQLWSASLLSADNECQHSAGLPFKERLLLVEPHGAKSLSFLLLKILY